MDRAKLVIVATFGVAIAMAAFAWWFRVEMGDEALRYWGGNAAVLIKNAPHVTVMRLSALSNGASEDVAETIRCDGRLYQIVHSRDISQARGIQNARQALIEDASFAWDEGSDGTRSEWLFGLRFSDGKSECTVLIDDQYHHVSLSESAKVASIKPIANGMKLFLSEQL